MPNPHDSLFRDTFGKPEHAGPLLRALLPAGLVAAIDWASLRPESTAQVDEQQQNQTTDQLFSVRCSGRRVLLYVVFEHTVRPTRWTALQVLAYMVGLWKEQRRREPKPRRLVPILPVVVSFGARRWRATTDLLSLIDLRGLDRAERAVVQRMLPDFAFTPHDFAAKSEAEIRAMGLSLLGLWTVAAQQFVAPVGHDEDAAARAIADWADVARRVLAAPTGQEAVAALSSYFLKVTKLSRKRLTVVFDQNIGTASMKKFVSTYDRITRESKAEGMAEGRADTLLRQLQKRFGPVPEAVVRRVRRSSIKKLDAWLDRVLDAESLAEVFAD